MAVTNLPTGKNRSREQTVAKLEELLELAKAGEIDSLACVYLQENVPMYAFTTLKDPTVTIGSLTQLTLQINNAHE